ncbi:MAG: fibronectin type III domain-containing protein, partial [Mycobacteriales bacterium]
MYSDLGSGAPGSGQCNGSSEPYCWMRELLYFDLTSIPAGSTVNSASLALTSESNVAGLLTANLGTDTYPVLQGWDSNATWDSAGDSNGSWTGGNPDTTNLLGQLTFPYPETNGQSFSESISTAEVQNWVNSPSSNFGMAMLADNDNGTAGTTTNNRERLASSLWTTCTSCGGNASQLPTLTVTYSPPPPPPVSSVSASASGTTISASWPASAGASTYYVETYQNGSYLTASQTSATSFAASGLPNDSYQFLVFAGNSGGWSSGTYSNTVTLAPPGPTSVSATVAGTTVEASWPAAPNATEYVASLFTASDTSSVLTTYSSSAQSASFAGLTPGAGYYVSVASCDSDGCGGSTWSNLATLAPDPPSSVSATPGTGQLSASWPAVSGATSYAASLYLDTYPSQQVASQQVGSSAVTFTGLTPGASYYVTVAACNAGGCSPATGSAVATLAPAAPASVTLTAGYLAASATWPAASGATSYATSLYLLPSPPTLVGSHTVATTSDAYSGLAPNASYELVVTACNATGCSGATTSNTVTLSPDTPASLTATGSGTTVAASWPATSGATSYLTSIATAADPAGVLASHTVTTTTDTFPGLTPGQAYQVTLAACSAAGCSPAITSGVVT